MNSSANPDQTTAVAAGEACSTGLSQVTTLGDEKPGRSDAGNAATIALDDLAAGEPGVPPMSEASGPPVAVESPAPTSTLVGAIR